MAQLIFDQESGSVTINGSIVYGTYFYTDRLNQFELPLADGSDVVYDGGPNIRRCLLVMKGISYDAGIAFEDWLKTKAVFALNDFAIISVTDGVDLGAGKGENILEAYYAGKQSTKDVLKLVAPGTWDLTFPYKFIES